MDTPFSVGRASAFDLCMYITIEVATTDLTFHTEGCQHSLKLFRCEPHVPSINVSCLVGSRGSQPANFRVGQWVRVNALLRNFGCFRLTNTSTECVQIRLRPPSQSESAPRHDVILPRLRPKPSFHWLLRNLCILWAVLLSEHQFKAAISAK
ncbi:hypothetical protein Bbelb_031200 [Branchiostoma belcheri]|nr:hypothetical protein Bbelb_031200 [Branchiostoma belcheri]